MIKQEEMTLMRIFIGESDRYQRQPLYAALVELFRREGFAGVTVVKGAMGFGSRSVVHSDHLLRLSSDLPVIVEVIESEEKIDRILPRLADMFHGGLITMEKARVIRFHEGGAPC